LDACDFGDETHAARTLNTARHDRVDQRTHIFVVHGAFILFETRGIAAIAHGLVLQITLTTLIANRAIQRVINQQEFHHAFARFFDGF